MTKMTKIKLPFNISFMPSISGWSVSCPYLSFPFRNHIFEIFRWPLSWMRHDQIKALQERLKRIAEQKIGYVPEFSFFVNEAWFKNKVVIICRDKNENRDSSFGVINFIGKYKNRQVVHGGPIFSIDENKGLIKLIYVFGIMYLFLNEKILTKLYLTGLTHVPKFFGIFVSNFKKVFPNMDPKAKPEKIHLDIKDMLLKAYMKEWNMKKAPVVDDHFIIKGFRKQKDGRILYDVTKESVPRHRDKEINDRFISMIDYKNGDEILQVCEIPLFTFFNPFNTKVFLSS